MKGKKYSDQQIIKIINEAEAGVPVVELSQQYGFSQNALRLRIAIIVILRNTLHN